MKRCIVPGEVGNFSSQINQSTGAFQIDGNPPGWKNAGFSPVLTPDWMKIRHRHHMDATVYSFLSAKVGKSKFQIPAPMQNVLLQPAPKWQNVFAIQIQTEILVPCTLTIYVYGITAYLSDTPIS